MYKGQDRTMKCPYSIVISQPCIPARLNEVFNVLLPGVTQTFSVKFNKLYIWTVVISADA